MNGFRKKASFDVQSSYPKWVWIMLDEFLGNDYEYTTIFNRLIDYNVDLTKTTFKGIKAFVTGMFRSEHWLEGGAIHYIEDGSALKVIKRLKELLLDEGFE